MGEARQGRDRHRQRRCPARRRPAGRGRARPAAGDDRRRLRRRRHGDRLGPDLKEELPVLFLRLRDAVVERKVDGHRAEPGRDRAVAHRSGVACGTDPARRMPRWRRWSAAGGRSPRARWRSGRRVALLADGPVTRRARPAVAGRVGRRSSSRPRPCCSTRCPTPRFLSGAAPGQRPRRARHGPRARPAARPGDARRRPRLVHGASGATVPAERGPRHGRHPRAPRPTAASTRSSCSAPTRSPTSPTATSPRRALAGAGTVIAVDTFVERRRARQADVVLAAAGFAEVDGTTTNLEGRVSTLAPEGHPPGHAPARLDDRRRAGRTASAPTSGSSRVDEHLGRDRALAPPRRHHAGCSICPPGTTACVVPTPPRRAAAAAGTHVAIEPAAQGRRSRRHGAGAGRRAEAGRGADGSTAPESDAEEPSPRRRAVSRTRLSGARRRSRSSATSPPRRRRRRLLAAARRHPQALRPRHARAALPSLAGLAAGSRLRREPADLDRLGVGADGQRRQADLGRAARSPSSHAGACVGAVSRGVGRGAFNQGGADRRRPHRRRRARHRHPGGDGRLMAAIDPLSRGIVDASVVASSCSSRSSSPSSSCCRHDADDLVRAQDHRRHAEPHRPEPGRPVGHPPDAGRRHQALLQGGPDPRPGRPARLPARARTCRSSRRSSRSAISRRRRLLDGDDGTVTILGHETFLQLADPPIGILFLLAMSSIAVYGVMLAGWSSGSKYPLLGSVRASAQMVSYEAALGLSVVDRRPRHRQRCRTHDIVRSPGARHRRTGTSSPPASCRS